MTGDSILTYHCLFKACANFKDVGKFCTEIAELKAEESYNSCGK